jgi:inositol transport system substrate-binding protein
MKKMACVFVVVLMAMSGLFAGGQQSGEGKIKIGYLNSNDNDTWLSYLKDEFISYFNDKPQYELLFENGQDDVVRQSDQASAMIVKGAKILVVIPIDSNSVEPITRTAADAKVPMIYLNRNPYLGRTFPPNVYYVGSDSKISGILQMEEMGKALGGKGNICILMGRLDHEAAVNRTAGNEEVIANKYPNIKILAKEVGAWYRDQGLTVTQNLLTAYPDLQGIVSNNDEMALGAIEAARSAGRAGIVVIGIDGTPDAYAAIKDGRMAATVMQDAAGQGRGAAEYVHRIYSGERVALILDVPYVLVNRDNLSQYMK